MYLLAVSLPILGAFTAGLFGRLLGQLGAAILTCSLRGLAALFSIVIFYEVALAGAPLHLELAPWFLDASWALLFDSLSSSLLLAVFVVSFLVHVFATYYRSHDPHLQRFMALLSAFTGSRGLLATGANYLILFRGWERIGVTSFLLICFWWTRLEAVRAARQARLYNRVGDTAFSIGLFAMLWAANSFDYGTLFGLSLDGSASLICILLLRGARAKSAQVPLHCWLPNSREGPTPVSSLLHAATLVTAGVYLLLRTSPRLATASDAQLAVTLIGSLTALFAATTGLVQNDLKRVIAYSTCSQIGYRIAATGRGLYDVALFHLCNHAFFKALLFLGAGGVLHGLVGEQDIRRLGGLMGVLPVTYVARLIGSLSLIAFPFRTGRYSKELLINSASTPVYHILLGAAALTAFYSARLLWLTFMGTPRATYGAHFGHEVPARVVFSYVVLSLAAIIFGYIFSDAFVGPGSDRITLPLQVQPTLREVESSWPLLPTILTFAGVAAFFFFASQSRNPAVYNFLINRWMWDDVLQTVPHAVLSFGDTVRKVADRGALELLGPHGLSNSISQLSQKFAALDRTTVTNLALARLSVAVLAITWIVA